jgi:hypothetical protein
MAPREELIGASIATMEELISVALGRESLQMKNLRNKLCVRGGDND